MLAYLLKYDLGRFFDQQRVTKAINLRIYHQHLLSLKSLFPFPTSSTAADISPILRSLNERKDLELVLVDLINGLSRREDITCVAFICDAVYLNVFEGYLFKRTDAAPYVMVT